jgi:hypothetical protein
MAAETTPLILPPQLDGEVVLRLVRGDVVAVEG